MSRFLLGALLALTALPLLPAGASAEIRTVTFSGADALLAAPDRPAIKDAHLRYDDRAGAIEVTVRFHQPLADPAQTSALRDWRVVVGLGDYFESGSCWGGDDRTALALLGALGDDTPARLESRRSPEPFTPEPAAKTFAADRSSVTLAMTSPRLVGLNLICGWASTGSRSDDLFSPHKLLDGFLAADGPLLREINQAVRWQADSLVGVSRGEGDALSWHGLSGVGDACRALDETGFACRVNERLRRAPGRPTLTIRGRVRFSEAQARKRSTITRDYSPWDADLRASLRYRRCPAFAPRAKRGRPCTLTARLDGHGIDLVKALRVRSR